MIANIGKSAVGTYRRMAQRRAEFCQQKADAEERCRQAEEELAALLHRHELDSMEQLGAARERYAVLAAHAAQLDERRMVEQSAHSIFFVFDILQLIFDRSPFQAG